MNEPSSSESSVHSTSAGVSNPFWQQVFEQQGVQSQSQGASPRHHQGTFRHQASTSSGEFLEPISPGGPSPSNSVSCAPQQIDVTELQQLDVIGSGGCGLVFRGRWGNKLVAIKQINQGKLQAGGAGPDGCSCPMSTEAWLQRFFNEAQTIWMARDHPSVVQLLGVCLQRYWLVFEFCAGGGLDFVIARCRLAPAVIIEWATQIASGMEWLHSVGIIHRDLKSCNILLKYPLPQLSMADAISELESWPNSEQQNGQDEQNQTNGNNGTNGSLGNNNNGDFPPVILKIADFGLARQLALDKSRVTAKYAEGTVRYLAPEVITSRTYSKASDVWSYGVVFWELLTGEQPYRDVEECAVMFRIGRQRRSLLPVPPSCPPAFASLLNDCWSSDPFNRPSFTAIIDRLSLSDLRVAEFTRTGTEFSSLQDSWRQIIENSFNELRVRQEELELADLALRERAAQQAIIDNRLRQWERQLAQRELRVVERELRALFMDDQHWRTSTTSTSGYSSTGYERRRRRSTSDTRFSVLSHLLSPRPSASRLRPPHRVSLSHLRRDRNLISRPLVSTMHVSHVVGPANSLIGEPSGGIAAAGGHRVTLPAIITTGVVDEPALMNHNRHNLYRSPMHPPQNRLQPPPPPPPSRSWISVPDILSSSAPATPCHGTSNNNNNKKAPSRVRQAIVGSSRLLAAVLLGHDPSGPRPPPIPLLTSSSTTILDHTQASSGPIYGESRRQSDNRLIEYESVGGPDLAVTGGSGLLSPLPFSSSPQTANSFYQSAMRSLHMFYIGDGFAGGVKSPNSPLSPGHHQASNSPAQPIISPATPVVQGAANFIDFDSSISAAANRPGWLAFGQSILGPSASSGGGSGQSSSNGEKNGGVVNGVGGHQTAPADSDSGMALSLGSVSGASGSQTSATTPLDTHGLLQAFSSTAAVNEGFSFKNMSLFGNGLLGPGIGPTGSSRYRQQRSSLSTELEDQRSNKNQSDFGSNSRHHRNSSGSNHNNVNNISNNDQTSTGSVPMLKLNGNAGQIMAASQQNGSS